jgi:glycosyltransferase involved in cell wall biosynthesis
VNILERAESTTKQISVNGRDAVVCYAANAVAGRGGQGEFLRQMIHAIDNFPHGKILSRKATGLGAKCIDLPHVGWRRMVWDAVASVPVLRRRRDILTLLDDIDFDSRLAGHLDGADLFDGVMGQCCVTLDFLEKRSVPRVLTALNTHIDNLIDVMTTEHRRLQIQAPGFIHPEMQKRARREIQRASNVRVVSDLVKNSFIERGIPADKIEVILPGVDLDHFRPSRKTDDTFRVLAVSSIDPRKGIFYLLQAFEKAAIPHSELVIIGATGDHWSKQMLSHFLARLDNVKIQAADVLTVPPEKTYGKASVLVHPAIEDGFALAVSQALACGKPVITTYQTGASQLIIDGTNGYILNCRDVDGLVDRLRLLARDEVLLNRLAKAAPSAVAHLGYDSFAENVAKLYRRVLAN